MEEQEIKKIVREDYAKIANQTCCCCSNKKNEEMAKEIGYNQEDLKVPGNLGLGCGNPLAFGKIKEGDIVLDLGSGAGFDCFLASKKVGKTGKVIGLDMTQEMIKKAEENAKKFNYENVKFILGENENIPLEDNSVDFIISNCVINLSPNKQKVFNEAYRVLRKNGKMYVSDIVLLGELTEEQKKERQLISGCVAGALQKEDYIKTIKNSGFKIKILQEDKDISKKQYNGISLESIKIEAEK